MATLVLCSASGAPGATVTALGLTLTWPRHVLLCDADRTPSQSILAGYLRGASARGLGMPGLLQAHREHTPLEAAIPGQTMTLPAPLDAKPKRGQPVHGISRRFLPGFTNLGAADVFGGVWRELGMAFQASTHDVILDAGRIGTRGLPDDMLQTATRVGVVARTSLVSLAALRLYLGLITESLPSDRVGLVLVGPGRPYRSKEVAEQFGVDVLAEIMWDPAGAADLHEGQTLSPHWRKQALARSYAKAAESIVASIEAERQKIGVEA